MVKIVDAGHAHISSAAPSGSGPPKLPVRFSIVVLPTAHVMSGYLSMLLELNRPCNFVPQQCLPTSMVPVI